MLRRLVLNELDVGMFVHKMEGAWFDHPFWRSKFLIETGDQLVTLQSSKLSAVIIDTERGKDIEETVSAKSGHCAGSGKVFEPQSRNRARTISSRARKADNPASTKVELSEAQAVSERAQVKLRQVFTSARLGKALNVNALEPVVSDILLSIRRNPNAFGGLMRCKLRNEWAYNHALAVSALMVALARKMKLSATEAHEAGLAGLLLDIGVSYLTRPPAAANRDPRSSDPALWEQHVMLGFRALSNDTDLPECVIEACLHHHERIDGGGFPNGLAGEAIGRLGKMAAICDTFDQLLNPAEQAGGLDPAKAVRAMQSMEGAFDPAILREFIESVGLYPIGSFVELESGLLAMVIDLDTTPRAAPIVQAFYSLSLGERVAPFPIVLGSDDCTDRITGIADLTGLALPDPEQLRELTFLSAHKVSG